MPIFDQGYRHWDGELAGRASRWWAISRRGVAAQMKNRWVGLTVLATWMFGLALAVVVILWGLLENQSQFVAPILEQFTRALPFDVASDPSLFRSIVWTFAFNLFFQFEMLFIMLLVLVVGPDLISQDLQFNAMPLYLSRPLRRVDYFLGKAGVIGVYLLAANLVPALIAYGVGVSFSFSFEVIRQTFPILLGSLAYGSIVVVSTATLMLAISSLSKNTRYVGAIWVGLWIVSGIFSNVLTEAIGKDWCALLSYTRNLHRMHHALLGTQAAWEETKELLGGQIEMESTFLVGDTHPWQWSAGVLLALFGVSVWVLTTRVKSLDRLR